MSAVFFLSHAFKEYDVNVEDPIKTYLQNELGDDYQYWDRNTTIPRRKIHDLLCKAHQLWFLNLSAQTSYSNPATSAWKEQLFRPLFDKGLESDCALDLAMLYGWAHTCRFAFGFRAGYAYPDELKEILQKIQTKLTKYIGNDLFSITYLLRFLNEESEIANSQRRNIHYVSDSKSLFHDRAVKLIAQCTERCFKRDQPPFSGDLPAQQLFANYTAFFILQLKESPRTSNSPNSLSAIVGKIRDRFIAYCLFKQEDALLKQFDDNYLNSFDYVGRGELCHLLCHLYFHHSSATLRDLTSLCNEKLSTLNTPNGSSSVFYFTSLLTKKAEKLLPNASLEEKEEFLKAFKQKANFLMEHISIYNVLDPFFKQATAENIEALIGPVANKLSKEHDVVAPPLH